MQLFDNFNNIPEDYIPDNMHPPKCPSVELFLIDSNVDPIYRKCRLVGYAWDYGESVNIEIKHQIHLTLQENAIYTFEDVDPTESTVGEVGQRYYNLYNLTSFVCESAFEGVYTWQRDENLTFFSNEPIEIDVPINMTGKSTIVELLNFRRELIDEKEFAGQNTINWVLTHEESAKYLGGIYYMNIYIVEEGQETLSNSYEIVIRGK